MVFRFWKVVSIDLDCVATGLFNLSQDHKTPIPVVPAEGFYIKSNTFGDAIDLGHQILFHDLQSTKCYNHTYMATRAYSLHLPDL
jgi:hypothetical protein